MGRPKHGPVRFRAAALALVLGSLLGCSQGGFLPGGPHALPAGQLSSLVDSASHEFGVKPNLIYAVIDAESHGDARERGVRVANFGDRVDRSLDDLGPPRRGHERSAVARVF